MSNLNDAEQALLTRITELAPGASALGLSRLSEAYAWVHSPNNAHGSAANAS